MARVLFYMHFFLFVFLLEIETLLEYKQTLLFLFSEKLTQRISLSDDTSVKHRSCSYVEFCKKRKRYLIWHWQNSLLAYGYSYIPIGDWFFSPWTLRHNMSNIISVILVSYSH